jgi:carboxyl-terminal processing protease
LKGVTPDITFPSYADAETYGEASYDNALPWTQIKPADYSPVGDLSDLLPLLQVRYEGRVSKDKEFQHLQEDIAEIKAQRQKNLISLNEAERRKERDQQEAKQKARDAEKLAKSGNKDSKDKAAKKNLNEDDGLQANERSLAAELAAEKAQKDAKDVLLDEAVQIMGDEVDLLKSNTKLAARVLPASLLNTGQKRQ